MSLRAVYAILVFGFLAIHVIAIQKLNALAGDVPEPSVTRMSGD